MMDAATLRRLKKDYKRLYRAQFRIMDVWAKAKPVNTNLEWKMYHIALESVADAIPPEQL